MSVTVCVAAPDSALTLGFTAGINKLGLCGNFSHCLYSRLSRLHLAYRLNVVSASSFVSRNNKRLSGRHVALGQAQEGVPQMPSEGSSSLSLPLYLRPSASHLRPPSAASVSACTFDCPAGSACNRMIYITTVDSHLARNIIAKQLGQVIQLKS